MINLHMLAKNDHYQNLEAAWENTYGTTASKKSRYTNKMTKYKTITNGKQLKILKLILYDNGRH